MVIIVTCSEIMALKCSGVGGWTEAECLAFILLSFARTPLIMVVLFISWGVEY